MKAARWIALLVFVVLSFAAGLIGQFAGGGSPGAWYRLLAKPSFTPPGWVFAPVWSLLYLMMGVAAWRVWLRRAEARTAWPLALFFVQLALNATWSVLFFGLHRIDWAFLDIVALWVAILATVVLFFRVRAAAGWLMIPYLAWVSFASLLNAELWRLNGPTG